METALTIIAGFLLAAGIVGCLVPVVPGPLMSFCGLLCLIPTARCPSAWAFAVFGTVTLVVTVLDYLIPAMAARSFKSSKWGVAGCVLGTILGAVFFFPTGLVAGPFIGAVAGEMLACRDLPSALKSGLGAFLGFALGVSFKLAACLAMAVFFAARL